MHKNIFIPYIRAAAASGPVSVPASRQLQLQDLRGEEGGQRGGGYQVAEEHRGAGPVSVIYIYIYTEWPAKK